MIQLTQIRPEFVEFIPKQLRDGVLYISEEYGTASHSCACGCGLRVVTPLTPTDWKVVREKNGTVSVFPSIGNWDYPCKSHYWIRQNRIAWAAAWSKAEIDAGREVDRQRKELHYVQASDAKHGWADKVINWLARWFS